MKDLEVKGRVLRWLYERGLDFYPFDAITAGVGVSDIDQVKRACATMCTEGLVNMARGAAAITPDGRQKVELLDHEVAEAFRGQSPKEALGSGVDAKKTASRLRKLATEGNELLQLSEPVRAHSEFERWVSKVGRWLQKVEDDPSLSVEWITLKSSRLVLGGHYSNRPGTWSDYRAAVRERVDWLARALPRILGANGSGRTGKAVGEEVKVQYVNPSRIHELSQIKHSRFDLARLVRLCEELNSCAAEECCFAVIMLVRAIMDHVPPIFGFAKFAEVASNHSGGRSFKDAMEHLSRSARKIADSHLHTHIRSKEVLPNPTQVNFSQPLDMLLGEVVRILKPAPQP